MRKYNNPRLLNTVVAGPGMKHPTKPHVIVGDNGEFIQGDLMDANAVGELVDQKIDDSEEHIIPKIDELSEQLEQEITNREAADEDLSETIDSRIQDVVGAAPEALDTLKELADALNDDANFAATVTNELTELDERVDNNTSGISSLNTRVASLETSTPDWNENDPISPSYIKNRTHYEESGPGVVYAEIEGTETKAQSFTTYYYTDYTAAQHSLVAGKRYYVIVYRGGEKIIAGYYTAAPYSNGIVTLSNAGYTTYSQYGNTIVPNDWGIRFILASNTTVRFESKNDYGTVHVIVSDNDPEGATVKTLDEKFIPATIARTADVDLGVLKTGGVTYNSGTNQFGYGGTSGGGYVNKINLNSGYITGLTGIYSLFDAPITISGASSVNINGVKINSSGSISEAATLSFKSGGTLTPSVIGVQEIFGKNNVHISMSGSTTGDGIDFGNAPLKNVNGITMHSGGKITGADLAGNGNNISGYSNITMRSSGYLQMIDGTLNVSRGTIIMDNANITGNILASGATINDAKFTGNTQMGSINISGSINAPYQTLTVCSITGVSGDIDMTHGDIYNASTISTFNISTTNISGASGAVNIGFSGAGISGKLDMISGILETSGVTLKSGGTLTFGDGTTMSTAATPTNLDDADNVIGGKELKIYYGTGGASMSPFSYTNYSTQLYIGRVSTEEVSCNGGIICSTISGTLRGTVEYTTFNSGNTFTSGFINELKTALGLS